MTNIPAKMKAFELTSYTADKDSFRVVEKDTPKVKENGVVLKMAASPINPSDLAFVRGMYGVKKRLPVVPGFEGSGTVVACGSEVKNIKVGMRVSCTASFTGDGTWAEYMATSEENCLPLTDEVTLEEGAAFFVNPLTAWIMVSIAEEGGHKAIVQTAAASALGKMVQKLCRRKNIPVINIVRRQEQVDDLQQLGSEYVLNSNDDKFLRELKKTSKKLEATFVLDAVAGQLLFDVLTAMPYASKALVYGALSEQAIPVNAGVLIFQKKSIEGFWLTSWLHEQGQEKVIAVAKEAQKYLKTDLHTEIYKKFSVEDAYEAIECYKENMSKGKVLIGS
ncbi:MAG: zinc-binding dehydrogenase [Spirochaetota bacterium]